MEIDKLKQIQEMAYDIVLHELVCNWYEDESEKLNKLNLKNLDVSKLSNDELYTLSFAYFMGYKTAISVEKCKTILKKLAKEGYKKAFVELSVFEFIEKKYEEGFKFLKVAMNDVPEAKYRMALCYYMGIGVQKNPEMAVKFFKENAKVGHASSIYYVACLMLATKLKENSVEDIKKCNEMIVKSAKKGCVYAKFDLAFQALVKNKKLNSDEIKLLIEAADGEEMRAQYLLALIYFEGQFVPKDNEKFIHYLSYSIDNGYKPAVEFYEKIKKMK